MGSVIDGTYSVMGGYKPDCPECNGKLNKTFDSEIDDSRTNLEWKCPECGYTRSSEYNSGRFKSL